MRLPIAHASTSRWCLRGVLLRIAIALGLVSGLVIVAVPPASAAVVLQPGDDIQVAIDARDPGTTFRLAAGTWNQAGTIRPKTGDRFLGEGAGQTILDGGGSGFDGVAGSATDVEIAHLTVRGFLAGVRTSSGWLVRDIEATGNEIGVRMNGSGTVIRFSSLHHNARFGVLGSTDGGQFLSNEVSFNRTDASLDPGYSGAAKWVNSANLLVDDNRIHDNYGTGLWLDIEDRACTVSNNQVTNNLGDGIRVEISFDNLVQGNDVEGNGSTALNVLNSSGTLVSGNTITAPASVSSVLRFAGNGRTDGGVEYANTGNRATANAVTLSSGQSVGVIRVQGTTSGNGFDANDYLVPSVLDDYFRWWDGATMRTVAWADWQGFGQDLTGSIHSTTSAPVVSGFRPARGTAGTVVTISGASFSQAARVTFSAAPARFEVLSDTRISATVPRGATSGPIAVTGPGGTGSSASGFSVIALRHQRELTIRLRGALLVEGRVRVLDRFPRCKRGVPVEIQRWTVDGWRTISTVSTDRRATFHARVPDRPGRYRARLSRYPISGTDVCVGAVSSPTLHL